MIDRELLFFATGRDLNNFFDEVITINLAAHLHEKEEKNNNFLRALVEIIVDDRNVIYESRIPRILSRTPRKLRDTLVILLGWLSLFRILKKKNVRLVRAEDARLNSILAFSLRFVHRSPVLVGVWGNSERIRIAEKRAVMPALFITPAIERWFETRFLRKADGVLVQNNENATFPKSIGVTDERIVFFPVGMTLNPIHGSGKMDLKVEYLDSQFVEFMKRNNALSVVSISRLESSKHVEDSINAFAMNSDLNVKLIIVGDGPERINLEKHVKHLRLESKIYFAGNKSQSWISGCLSLANINLIPGWGGRVLLESSLYGLPTLAYDIDWHSDLIENEVNGLLVPYRNVELLGKKLRSLIMSYEDSLQMGNRLKDKAALLFSPSKLASTQLEVYNKFSNIPSQF